MIKKLLFQTVMMPILMLIGLKSNAQIKSVMIGVNGLTCSACCRTVEMSIRKLSFVKDVHMNLENTEGEVLFKNESEIEIDKIATAITNAGFSVRYLNAKYLFSNLKVDNGICYDAGKFNLQFFNLSEKNLNGETVLKFAGKQFQPKSEYNKVKLLLIDSCADKHKQVYFVTL